MKRFALALVAAAVLGSVGTAGGLHQARAAGSPVITSLSATTLARSGRLLITGTGFGVVQGSSTAQIGGLVAPVTRWSDTLVVAYVPEAASLGAVDVKIVVSGASSNPVPLTVQARQLVGRVKWRFQVDARWGYLLQRPAVGADGTVVAHDPAGNVYALSPDGGLKWIARTQGADAPPSIGSDGTVYVGAGNTISALAAGDGTVKWTFTEPAGGQGVIAGPTVGPDGNVYAVTDLGGLGAFALSPSGQLLWSTTGSPPFYEYAQIGAEVAFGQGQLYAAFDQGVSTGGVSYALTLAGSQRWGVAAGGSDNGGMQAQRQPTVGPDGTVYMTAWGGASGSNLFAFDPATGATKWDYSPWPSNGMSEPTVGIDGTVYVGRSLSYLDAVTPAGLRKWSVLDGGILAHPTVNSQNTLIVAGEAPNYGEPGVARAFSAANGQVQWSVPLPSENGGYQVLYSRPRFAPDGRTVFFGTFISAPESPDQYAYLYAVDTSGSASPPPPPPPPPPAAVALKSLTVKPAQVRGGSPSTGTVTLSAAAPGGGVTIALASSAKTVAATPASVTVPAGASSASFKVATYRVARQTSVTISATLGSVTKGASLTVMR